MTCPDCHGEGTSLILVHGHIRNHRCFRCNGNGNVPDAMAEWIKVGSEMRERRVNGPHGYRSIHEEARRRGMDSATLSKMELGKIKPIPDEER